MTRWRAPRREPAELGPQVNPSTLWEGIAIPTAIVQLPTRRLNAAAKIVFGRLKRYAGKRGVAFPHVRTLALEVGQSRRAVERALAHLRRVGLISTEQRGKGRASLIRFHLPADIFGELCTKPAPPKTAGHPGSTPPKTAGQGGAPLIVRARGSTELSHTEEVGHRSAGGRPVGRGPVFSQRGHVKNQQRLARLLSGVVKRI